MTVQHGSDVIRMKNVKGFIYFHLKVFLQFLRPAPRNRWLVRAPVNHCRGRSRRLTSAPALPLLSPAREGYLFIYHMEKEENDKGKPLFSSVLMDFHSRVCRFRFVFAWLCCLQLLSHHGDKIHPLKVLQRDLLTKLTRVTIGLGSFVFFGIFSSLTNSSKI